MTDERNNNDRTVIPGEDWAMPVRPANPGLGRRTVLTGAAWSLPVIALAVATPLAAASATNPTLTFVNGPYAVDSCDDLGPVTVEVATGDPTASPAGQSVNVTLPAGLAWADGTTEATRAFGPTDASGRVTIPAGTITTVGTGGGDFSLIATASNGASATAPVVVTMTGEVINWDLTFGYGNLTTALLDATLVGYNMWLRPNGDLWYGNGVIASGVTRAAAEFDPSIGVPRVSFTQNGVAQNWDPVGGYGTVSPVLADATPVGFNMWLRPNGDLWYGNGVIASGVTGAVSEFDSALGIPRVSFTQNGVAQNWDPVAGYGTVNPVLADATLVGYNMWLRPNGELWYGNGAIASGVTRAAAEFDPSIGVPRVSFTQNGVAQNWDPVGGYGTLSPVLADATPVGYNVWLRPNGDLWYGSGVIASGVTGAISEFDSALGIPHVSFITRPNCF
jgi:hypothetical protein